MGLFDWLWGKKREPRRRSYHDEEDGYTDETRPDGYRSKLVKNAVWNKTLGMWTHKRYQKPDGTWSD